MYGLKDHKKTFENVKSCHNMHHYWNQLMTIRQLLNLPLNSENYYISAQKLTKEKFDNSASLLWIENEDPHTNLSPKGILDIFI